MNDFNPPERLPDGDCYCTFSSGSKGNCAFLRLDGTSLLIDAGISARKITSNLHKLGEDPSKLDGILITHEHCDHIRGLEIITKHTSSPVWFPVQSDEYIRISRGERRPIPPNSKWTVGNLEVESFYTPHDSLGSVGYIVRSEAHTAGYCTDLGRVEPEILEKLAECDSLVLESNHDLKMLENGRYPRDLKDRIRSRFGHLSNDDCAKTVAILAENGLKTVVLAHLSEENNLPELAYNATSSACGGKSGMGRTKIRISTAGYDRPEWLIC